MVGGSRIELLTSSVSTKRSTSELTAHIKPRTYSMLPKNFLSFNWTKEFLKDKDMI